MPRKIIHIDCDCFYAAVEMRDNPALKDVPLAVGGKADSRGVIATCNYVARKFGVRSAMSSITALKRCPNLVILLPDMVRYRAASQQIMSIYKDFTPIIEPLSLDEAYLDVSEQNYFNGSASLMAGAIRHRIEKEVGITASAGIASNKFLAKIASDWNKPNGQFLIHPNDVDAFMPSLPINKIFGVGKVTAAHMNKLGIFTCGDLQKWSLLDLAKPFGSFADSLYHYARGIDNRQVHASRTRKSVSCEETFVHDLVDEAACANEIPNLLKVLEKRLARIDYPVFKVIVLKLKFNNFKQTTVETQCDALDTSQFLQLLHTAFTRANKPVRLIGVGVKLNEKINSKHTSQLALFDTLD